MLGSVDGFERGVLVVEERRVKVRLIFSRKGILIGEGGVFF